MDVDNTRDGFNDRVELMAAELSSTKGEMIGVPSTQAWKTTIEMIASRHGMAVAAWIRYCVNEYSKQSDPDFPMIYEHNIRGFVNREAFDDLKGKIDK